VEKGKFPQLISQWKRQILNIVEPVMVEEDKDLSARRQFLVLGRNLVLFALLTVFLLFPGIIMAQETYGPPIPWKDFKAGCVFLGIAKEGEALIALYLREEMWSYHGLIIRAYLVPTENFPFESGYRGFQKIDRYRIKKGEGLRLTYDDRMHVFSLNHHVDIGDTTPILAEFLSRQKRKDLIPDDIKKVELDIKDVYRWDKVPKKELPMWERSFEATKAVAVTRGNRTKAPPGTAGKESRPSRKIDEAEYRSRYVTLNGTYIFERKTVYSPIIAVLDLGTLLEHTKPAGAGWIEVLYGDEQKKGYVLSVYLVEDQEEASRWEREKGLQPLAAPLGREEGEEGSGEAGEP
jgi:hypothetical protein